MKLNRAKLIEFLSKIKNINLLKKREKDNIYKNKTITFWNNLLWKKILEHKSINGSGIDLDEFYNYCGYYCDKEKCNKIFNMINNKTKSIYFSEFEDFLLHLDNIDYNNIINCLELDEMEKTNKLKINTQELLVNKEIVNDNIPKLKRIPTPIPPIINNDKKIEKNDSNFKSIIENNDEDDSSTLNYLYNKIKSFFI